ncbi:MAG: hypothetical protein ACLQHK_13170 [Gallionellaceae bacterium]
MSYFALFLRLMRGEKEHAHRTDQQHNYDEDQDAAPYAAVVHDNPPSENRLANFMEYGR